ncbi:Ubiquitin thioesterase OTU1 [Phytophthora megakarya]|uniref:ubiquitinyl hydrolase 1 n=1 Tax=Phytophthora megakarya TaxID=4795 RepID=A0A225VHW1_9STRA|nr:Ubiquitin thioesterase OTU1 [Phytophthora megakarya]
MPMNFKVTFANGTSIRLMGLPDDITLDGLRAHLFEKTAIPPQDQHGMDDHAIDDGVSPQDDRGIRCT